MDVDATEIQVWTRQVDGTHQMRWVPLRELMKLMAQVVRDTPADEAKALGEQIARPLPASQERS